MTQPSDSDYSQASGASGTALRTALNDYFQGILSKNSGTTAPSDTFAGMDWIDTSLSPPRWKIRNQADTDFDDFANIDPTNGIQLLNEGAAVVALSNTSAFTQPQTMDITGAPASWILRSDVDTGLASFLSLGGENDANEQIIGVVIEHNITDNTDGSEDSQCIIKVLQAGSSTTRVTVGDTVAITGTLNATTLQQGGTTLAAIIEAEKGNMDPDSTSATTVTVPDDLTRGERNRFTGSSASTWTIDSGTAGDVFPVRNRGTATITFVAGTATIVGGLSLAADKVCTIEYDVAGTALIYGENI